jgi:hypothetical protein
VGIRSWFTTPFSQQNGVVERRNRTVMEMSRAMMKSMNVPGRLWGEAVRQSVYLLNRLPTRIMGHRTPFEALCGKRPQLGHVRVFGCRANVRPATPHLKKLDDRSVPMVYLGVEDGSKAHRLCNPQTRRIVVSRDVVFEEAISWKWNSEYSEGSEFVVDDEVQVVTQTLGTDGGHDANQDDH